MNKINFGDNSDQSKIEEEKMKFDWLVGDPKTKLLFRYLQNNLFTKRNISDEDLGTAKPRLALYFSLTLTTFSYTSILVDVAYWKTEFRTWRTLSFINTVRNTVWKPCSVSRYLVVNMSTNCLLVTTIRRQTKGRLILKMISRS